MLTRRPWLILAAVAVGAAVVLLIVTSVPVRQNLGWIDAISGSRKNQTVWCVGRTRLRWATAPTTVDSPLAVRFRQLGLTWQPDWRSVQGTSVNVFGRSIGAAAGPAPAIHNMATNRALQDQYIKAASDDELRELFRIMSSGTEAEQELAVERAMDVVMP